MIYNLKKLKDRNLRATEYGNPTSDFAVIRSEILLAIAERLEALVEAQKPRLQGEPDRNENETPQPVATLCEAVDSLIELVPQIKCVNIYDVEQFGIRVNAVKEALTAERKRAELVENLIDAARRFYQENDGRYDLLRVRLSELDAFDRGAENG